MSAYIISLIIDGDKFASEKCSNKTLPKAREEFAYDLKFAREHGYEAHIEVVQAYETHVRAYSLKRQEWVNDADNWEDPCLGCGGYGAGWVRECPCDCYGKRWHAYQSEMIRRYVPRVIW